MVMTDIDLRQAVIEVTGQPTAVEMKAVTMLIDEVEARTGIRWTVSPASGNSTVISIGRAQNPGPAEGYSLTTASRRVSIQGNDERGVLFGAGRLLRELEWGRWKVRIASGLTVQTSPAYPVRGHQLGYRTVNNTYDAWTPAEFEQYLRDLIAFGCNSVELIPPRADVLYEDGADPHFRLPKQEMMEECARIVASYGLDVWIWYPAYETDGDYSNPAITDRALREWDNVIGRLPRVNGIYIPGGDPGHCEPKVLMAFLEKASGIARRHHRDVNIFVSAQGFNEAWMDQFIEILKTEPPWLDGVIYAPWTRVSVRRFRSLVPDRYPIRYCPDITHCMHSKLRPRIGTSPTR